MVIWHQVRNKKLAWQIALFMALVCLPWAAMAAGSSCRVIHSEALATPTNTQAETGRIHSICYSERLLNRSTVKAGELVQAGAIGRVLQTISLGPHRRRFHTRPDWFFQRERYGGILCDIGSHQIEQFLFFTGASDARDGSGLSVDRQLQRPW